MVQLACAGAAFRQRVASGGDHDDLIAAPLADRELRVAVGPLDETDVGAERGDPLEHVMRVGDIQQHVAARVRLLPPGDQHREQVLADRVAGGQPQRRRMGRGEQGFRLHRLLQDSGRARQQGPPILVDDQLLAHPVEELRTKHGLQLAERVTRGRLRARDLVSRGPRRAAARHRREHLQLAQRELQSLIDFLIHCNRNYAAHESVRCLA